MGHLVGSHVAHCSSHIVGWVNISWLRHHLRVWVERAHWLRHIDHNSSVLVAIDQLLFVMV